MGKEGGSFGKNHAIYERYENLHLSVGSFDGGACVGPHGSYYKQFDSCSYRWQAAHRATGEDRDLYGKYEVYTVRTRAASTAATMFANNALNAIPTALAGGKAKAAGLPFRTGFSPWANNAHHLLPDAELKGGIGDTAAGEAEALELIIVGLLKHKYNLNHHENMMILPQQDRLSTELGLPTHPWGDSHPSYSAKVRGAVVKALAKYKPIVRKMKDGTYTKEHKVPDPLDVVKALVAISKSMHAQIKALAVARRTATEAGEAAESISVNNLASMLKF